MSFLDSIFNFLRDKTLSFSRKSLIIFSVLLFIFFIDLIFGFSFNYSINQRLSQIEKIENLKQNYNLNDTLLSELSVIEHRLLNRLDYVKLIYFRESESENDNNLQCDSLLESHSDSLIHADTSLLTGQVDSISDKEPNKVSEISKPERKTKLKKVRNWKWDLISSTYMYMLVIILLLFVPFTQTDNFLALVAGAILTIAIVAVLGWINYLIFKSIPTLWKPWINYILNALIHLVISTVLGVALISKKDKK